ncbi:MAG TPA: 7-carboxy-7-deazaguanine synthase QueE [Bacteroidota bacterium]|nr:7-carboxy-7-deazaguanine synthase QueE [Bacteroidota bacterium]
MQRLTVNEIFYSIQGESTFAGLPCVFVRLTYCNLRCVWCDTEYAFYEGKEMSLEEILDEVTRYPCKLVEVTGGEPLAQNGVHELMTMLCNRGYTVLLETSGSISIAGVDPRVRIIMDIKCPGSGMEKRNLWENIEHLRPTDEVKFVVAHRGDFDWAVGVVGKYQLEKRCTVLFSPVFGEVQPVELAQWLLESGMNARMQLQLHKFIWEPETRGV